MHALAIAIYLAFIVTTTASAQLEWVEEQKLRASDGASYDFFGRSVSISGDVAIVGAFRDDDMGLDSGSAYIYRFNGAEWVEEQKLLASDGAEYDYFGNTVSISGGIAIVGAYGTGPFGLWTGSAYIFQRIAAPCPADITGPDGSPDGTVDVNDLLLLRDPWGTAGPEGDITGIDSEPDGVVDVHDLLAILTAWGPCE